VRLLGSGSHATAFPYGPIGTSLVPAQHRNSLPFSTSSQPLHKTPPVVIVPSLSWQTYARWFNFENRCTKNEDFVMECGTWKDDNRWFLRGNVEA
jgi:hypothetical protein